MAQRERLSLRPRVVLAIARRDLATQLRGRRGWVLPFIAAILLAPLAAAPLPSFAPGPPQGALAVSGDVPEAVSSLEGIAQVPQGGIRFIAEDERLVVQGAGVPPNIREVLDAGDAAIVVRDVPAEPWPVPGRALVLALLASSILTGAVSESIPGERSRHTLEPLLTAAVSRAEVVVGKWLAWAGFGTVAATSAALLAVLFGRMDAGWWLLALPTVPMGTVALGLYLVRRARDVVGGATVSLRVLPAVLSILGIVAWFIGLTTPELGAVIPLGGALVAAGGTWEGPLAPLLGAGITLSGTLALLWLTSRDLERMQRSMSTIRLGTELWTSGWVLLAWWTGLGAAAAWVAAGNPVVGRELLAWPGLAAAALGVAATVAVRVGNDVRPGELLGLHLPRPAWSWALTLPLGALAGATVWTGAWTTWVQPGNPTLDLLLARQGLGLWPLAEAPVVGVLALILQELTFRGWLQRTLGPIAATILFALVVSPLDPVSGLVIGGALALLTRLSGGSVVTPIVARLLAAGVALGAGFTLG